MKVSQNAKPAAARDEGGGHRKKVQISDFRPLSKHTLKGVFTLRLPSGMIIHGCMLHESNGARWIGLPGKPYTDSSGKQTFSKILEFSDRATADRFRDAVLEALDAHLAGVAQ